MSSTNDLRYSTEGAAALLHEIERLRAELDKAIVAINDLSGVVKDQQAEIERLRGLVGIESPDLDLDWNRLRSGDNRALISDHQDVFDMLAGMRDEIERLRGLVEECAVFLKEDETPAQRIARERADTEAVLKLLLKEKRRTQKLQDKIDRWQGDAECLGRSLTERNAEIERLRGLLREAQENTTSDGLWLRIEEALGDGDKE
jgi:chromosome segregation ATPase